MKLKSMKVQWPSITTSFTWDRVQEEGKIKSKFIFYIFNRYIASCNTQQLTSSEIVRLVTEEEST
jgi:hypothetical protein